MKIIKLSLPILLAIGFIACKPSVNYSIEGNIEGLGNDTLYVEYIPVSDMETTLYDTLVSVDGKFATDRIFEEPVLWTMTPKGSIQIDTQTGETSVLNAKQIELIVGLNENIKVKGMSSPEFISYTATGSDIVEAYAKMRETTLPLVLESEKLWKEVNKMWADAQASLGVDEKFFDSLLVEARASNAKIANVKLDYVKANPKKMISALYLSSQPVDTLGLYYEVLDEQVKNGVFKTVLDARYDRYLRMQKVKENEAKVVVGVIAPEFTLKNMQGKEISLSSLKGKYLVLDFWGSWCSWCIKGIPDMKKYYAKYSGKVEFVGIACRDKEEAWKNAVAKYDLPWVQLINGKDMNEDVSVLYGVQGFPTKFILDKNLKIVAKVVGEGPEFYQKLDNLLK